MHFFCSSITQNVSFCFYLVYCMEHARKRVDMCGDQWKDQDLVTFSNIYFGL